MNDAPKSRVHWPQISLRGLLALVALIGIGISCVLRWDVSARRQHEAVAILNSSFIEYEDHRDPTDDAPGLVKLLPGIFYFDHFYKVIDLSLSEADDDQMRLLEDLPDLESLCLFSAPQCSDAGLARIKSLKRLKQLDLFDVPGLNNRTLAVIGSVKGLQHLRLECGNKVSDAGLAHLSRLHKLKSLTLKCGLGVTDRGLATLANLSSLEQLGLDLDNASNVTVELIDLSWFDVSYDKPIRGRSLARLGALKRLTSLGINGNAALNDECLSHLPEIPGLKSLRIQATTGLTDSAVAHLAELKVIQTLILDCGSGRETDAGVASLARLSGLKKLAFALGPAVSDVGLATLNSCPNLQRLKLHLNNRITGDGLARLERLKYLELDHKTRSDDAPPIRLRLPAKLDDLVVHGGAGLTDEDLDAVAALSELRRLDLFWCEKVSDGGLDHLKALSQLKELGIHWCARTTDAKVAELRTSLPNCKITVSSGGGSFGFWNRF
jgi:hypothetical protein